MRGIGSVINYFKNFENIIYYETDYYDCMPIDSYYYVEMLILTRQDNYNYIKLKVINCDVKKIFEDPTEREDDYMIFSDFDILDGREFIRNDYLEKSYVDKFNFKNEKSIFDFVKKETMFIKNDYKSEVEIKKIQRHLIYAEKEKMINFLENDIMNKLIIFLNSRKEFVIWFSTWKLERGEYLGIFNIDDEEIKQKMKELRALSTKPIDIELKNNQIRFSNIRLDILEEFGINMPNIEDAREDINEGHIFSKITYNKK